jgi:hypothetical protein
MFHFDFSFSDETHGIAICDEARIPITVIASASEAIQGPRKRFCIASSQALLAMTVADMNARLTCIRSLAARRARSFEVHPPS